MPFPRLCCYSLLLGLLILPPPLVADEPRRILVTDARENGVGQDIGFVEKLVQQSAAARQILHSDNPQAHALRDQAIAYLDEARAAEVKGDAAAVTEALDQAKAAIFMAMRLVGTKAVNDKRQENYNKKRQSLESLLAAHQRVREEQAQTADSFSLEALLNTERHIQERLQAAQAHYEREQLVEAMEVLNDAYLSLKLSLTRLRDGKTLVRSLHFETKQDEYQYELRRNNTHSLLINTVLKEKRADPRLGRLMDIPLAEAEKLRAQAEQQARNGDFEAAIKTLETSTSFIIRAIRLAGVFIPG
ncbi:MAG: hypothetical protein RRB22_09700 [Gammaproteobacteria bacterium]|nr:hypothetical protein [Gammaproteobacteria bacterium]